ncbi:MAG: site-specific DNA-methyltransferase [Desulfobacteraceae bacterium]|nr:MAG: site-specific DNA-methyltransferase [Desulfobacteraceae bacterium]
MAKKKNTNTMVESIRHKDKRRNIPTEELRDFVADDEQAPKTMLYPRDPSLDPQLVWKGKDEQDCLDLAVPVVPIYIQEKIHPQAIIAALPRKEQPGDNQLDLFADFNGGPEGFEQKIDFYRHDQNWSNRMILGDSLLVMTSLSEKEGLKGKVQTIYFDPPYGIKFGSNWQVSTRKRDVKDGKAEDATRQPEQVRAFRDTWKLGIHSYLAYLRDRLVVARELLTETGSVFVQIGDENVHLVRCVLDEVFGSENFIGIVVLQKTSAPTDKFVPTVSDFILWYGKERSFTKYRQLYREKGIGTEGGSQYTWVELSDGTERRLSSDERENPSLIPLNSRVFAASDASSSHEYSLGKEPVNFRGRSFTPGGRYWSTSPDGMNCLKYANRLVISGNTLFYKRYLDDFPVFPLTNIWTDTSSSFGERLYVVQTTAKTIERCLLMSSDPGDLVLDPTCGSGTTAYVAEQWGRRWITIDTSRVALALARTRLMAAKYPYYLLADSLEGIKKEAELTGKFPPPHPTEGDIRKGFVYKRVPHITLKSIANNPDIKEGMTRKQIDEAIARHADTETLFDQPYEDNKTLRVTGPFTVESLSPHRVLATDTEMQDRNESADFAAMILENLRKAGVQNTKKGERLKFDTLEPFAGSWLHAAGTYTEKISSSAKGKEAGEKVRRVAVSIGPEQGTVGPQQVKEAAKEAVQGIGYDLLIVCGFAFDPHVSEEVKRYGSLNVLPARMNPDLAMGDELLKKTGAGNLFMVFGEPDVDIKKNKSGKLTAEIKGVDVYDPTTGQIRSSSTDDIACWFIDTNYNGESFFVRYAYFTGADEPYDKLKRALRAEIDEAAWASLYSTKSSPFDSPETGKIAVKVINHYGDEVLKVFEI